jgi:DNA-binding transcriptional LysR family regulator
VLREMTAREEAAALDQGAIDLGLTREVDPGAGLAARTVFTDPVICLLPARHRLAANAAVSIADLRGEPILNLAREHEPAAHDHYVALYRRLGGFEPRIVHEVSQIATILMAIEATGCVALGPADWRALTRAGVVYRPLADRPTPTVSMQMAWNPDRTTEALKGLLAIEDFSLTAADGPQA